MSTGWNNEDLVEIVGVTPADASSHVDYGRFHQQIAVEQLFELPQAKPDIDHLVKIHAAAEVTRTKVISTPVGFTAVVSGVVRQKIIYVADSPEQPLHSAQFERPFCSFIPLPEEDKEDDWEKEEGKPEHQDYAKARTVLVDVVVQPTGKRAIHLYAILFLWLEEESGELASASSPLYFCCRVKIVLNHGIPIQVQRALIFCTSSTTPKAKLLPIRKGFNRGLYHSLQSLLQNITLMIIHRI